MLTIVLVIIAVMMVPLVLFFALIGLTLTIWCWNRIGRYFVNFGRWIANWRNFVPLAGCGTFALMVFFLLLNALPGFRMIWTIMIVLNILIAVVAIVFAMILWTIGLCRWAWPPYRRFVWRTLGWVWDLAGRQQPAAARQGRPRRPARTGTGTGAGGQPSTPPQEPEKRSFLGTFWALLLGKPRRPPKSTPATLAENQPGVEPARQAPPAKRSWFATFWALMLGKPQPKRQPARAARVQTTEQTVAQRGNATAGVVGEPAVARPRPKKQPAAKRSWFSTFWALMLGKPSKSAKKKASKEATATNPQASSEGQSAAAVTDTGTTNLVGEPGTNPGTGKKKEKAAGGFFSRIGRRLRDGVDWIRVRLNLD